MRAAAPPAPPISEGGEATEAQAEDALLGGGVLPLSFYSRPVLEVAPDLIGCVLVHGDSAGVIVETEAYHESEPACHAFVGLTPRTEILFGAPGRAYVYRSYGIHALFNAVCEPEGVGAAVLIRAVAPLRGLEAMRRRRGGVQETQLCSGPGKLTQALGIELSDNGVDLSCGRLAIRGPASSWMKPDVQNGPRVGITKATELQWRFCLAGNDHVSRPRPRTPLRPRSPRASRSRPNRPPRNAAERA